MDEREALLAAIIANPDDDLPRLVFADWLEETGHPANAARARYIRLHIEAEQFPIGSLARKEIERKALEHRADFQDEVDQILPPNWGVGCVTTRRRGFVHTLGGWIDDLFRVCPKVFELAPVEHLQFKNLIDVKILFADAEYLQRIRKLSLHRTARASLNHSETFASLIRSKHLCNLIEFDVSETERDDRWLVVFTTRLSRASFRDSLQILDLSRNWLTDASAHLLGSTSGLENLEMIRLGGNRITPAGEELLRRRFGDRVDFEWPEKEA